MTKNSELSTRAYDHIENPVATLDGGIVTPVPQWRRSPQSPLVSFDGGTRFSFSVVGVSPWISWAPRVLRALDLHRVSRQPVPLGDGGAVPLGDGGAVRVCVRGASADELAYFSDYPAEGAVCFVSDCWRVILRLSVLNGVLSARKNDGVVIFGWRAFVENSTVSGASARVFDFLSAIGLEPTLQTINRLDVNATVDDVPMELVRACFHGGRFWTRSTPGLCEGTVYFGRRQSAVLFRVYDKSAELRAAIDTPEGRAKLRALAEYFPRESLEHLTRFEFEIHKKELDRFAVRDFRDLEIKLSAILNRLCRVLLTVRDIAYNKTRSDRHRSRVPVSDWWQRLADSFELFARQICVNQIQFKTKRQARTTGEKSRKTVERYARIMLDECFRVRREFDESSTDSDLWRDVLSDLMSSVLRRSPAVGECDFNPRELLTRYTLESLNDAK